MGRQDRSGAIPPRLPVPERLSASRQWPSQGGERLLSSREGFKGFLVWPEKKIPSWGHPGHLLHGSTGDHVGNGATLKIIPGAERLDGSLGCVCSKPELQKDAQALEYQQGWGSHSLPGLSQSCTTL